MKKAKRSPAPQPAHHHITILGQLLKLIPRSIVSAAAQESGVEAKARTFSVMSHLASMIFVQLAHLMSLNDVCDWLHLKSRSIASLGLTAPSRNNLSHANKERDASFVELVFWRTLARMHRCEPTFSGKRPGGRRLLHASK